MKTSVWHHVSLVGVSGNVMKGVCYMCQEASFTAWPLYVYVSCNFLTADPLYVCVSLQDIKKKISKCKDEKSPHLDLSKCDVSQQLLVSPGVNWTDSGYPLTLSHPMTPYGVIMVV